MGVQQRRRPGEIAECDFVPVLARAKQVGAAGVVEPALVREGEADDMIALALRREHELLVLL
ncbi:MAG TPA: hypothetical protein VGK73_10915, partial [Polyangiaceae bacterium]